MARPASVIDSHWSTLIEDLDASPLGFYEAIEEAIARWEIPDVSFSRHDWSEGGPLSPKRTYLRVVRKDHVVDICGAPFGRGFFVSEWRGQRPLGVLDWLLPWRWPKTFGKVFGWLPFGVTYFEKDSADMFGTAVHSAVTDVVNEMTQTQGLRALSEAELQPTERRHLKAG